MNQSSRRGTSLVELLASGVLLSAIAGLVIPSLSWTAMERRASQTREQAIAQVANVLEVTSLRPWDELTKESLADIKPTDWITRQLSDPQLSADVVIDPDDADAKQLIVSLSWLDRGRQRGTPVRLTTWVYRQEVSE